jgi:hypothetical protein
MIAWHSTWGNIAPENIDRQTLIRVMQIRDFRRFSPDLVERLTCRAKQEFGRHSPNKPTFEFSSLEKKVHVYFQTHRSSVPSSMERNLTLMARTCYFQWMDEYQSATPSRKAVLMSGVVEDMRHWQTIYLDYVRALGQPEPTLAELYKDFQRMIESFKVDASPEEVARIDSFAKEMSRALFVVEAQKSFMNFFMPSEQKPKN